MLEQELQEKVRLLIHAQQQEAMVVRREAAVRNVTDGGVGQCEAQVKVNI